MTWTETDQRLARYWGKADPALALTGGATHHTVLGHSLDVAAVAFGLVDRHPVLRSRIAAVSGTASEAVAITLAAVCAVHDIGKLDSRFQRKAPAIADVLRPASAGLVVGSYDHGSEGFRQVEDDEATAALATDVLGAGAIGLLRAVCGHHGALPTRAEPDGSRMSIPRALRREDELARRDLLALTASFFTSRGAALPWTAEVDAPLVQRLGGLCAVADWVGSNVAFFPYAQGPIDLATYWDTARERAAHALDAAGLLRAPAASDVGFGTLFPGYAPRDVQTLTCALESAEPALVIVEAEMGKGKTEAALALAAQFLAHGLGDGLTVALPTMATSNAMFARVTDVTPRIFAGDEIQLALAHGRARHEPRFQRLIERGLRARDPDATEASVMCARWLLNKKRVLLAQVGIGTIDQCLQAGLVVRHQFVRMFGLARNVVIIDEVHAYDAYMEVLLEHLVAWLGALRVPVILLSATLPSVRRAALARAWQGTDETTTGPLEDFEGARSKPYPLVTIATRADTQVRALAEDAVTTSRTLRLELAAFEDDAEHVRATAGRLVQAAKSGARVVWIRNTVREAQRAYRALVAEGAGVEHLLFHARFRGCDRRAVEQRVLARFGKDAPPGGRVLVATQVVEQSLDLDFDELHTDLAPIDLMFQRAGRLHRHVRPRPAGFETPRLVVHLPTEHRLAALQFGPSRYVYDEGTLWIAARAVRARATLTLPGDIRPLVEETYHPSSRARLLALGGAKLEAAEQRRELVLVGKRTAAAQCCIPPTTADADGGSAIDDSEDSVHAFTRDGQSTTLLPFSWDGEHARALYAEEASAPWHLDAARDDAWKLGAELLDQTLSMPARADVDASPSRADARWDAWRTRFRRFAEECGLGHRTVPLPMRRQGELHKGWLQLGARRRRVLYTSALGLWMPSDEEEQQR